MEIGEDSSTRNGYKDRTYGQIEPRSIFLMLNNGGDLSCITDKLADLFKLVGYALLLLQPHEASLFHIPTFLNIMQGQ
ncbi:hypothetical protein CUMW_223430 [Citrus unshiu]|uniref:Uncharacterized protein n=1 Tax=Citrus unshiu TaxID=55188 RepID=A0A2H5QG34_CITUN|nr:hypothetical protein CUMW_223430 [Citrus unshiu]